MLRPHPDSEAAGAAHQMPGSLRAPAGGGAEIDTDCPAKLVAMLGATPETYSELTPSVGSDCHCSRLDTYVRLPGPGGVELRGMIKSGVIRPRSAKPWVATSTCVPAVLVLGRLLVKFWTLVGPPVVTLVICAPSDQQFSPLVLVVKVTN